MSEWGYVTFIPALVAADPPALLAALENAEWVTAQEATLQGFTITNPRWDRFPCVFDPQKKEMRPTINGEVPTVWQYRMVAQIEPPQPNPQPVDND